MSVILLLTGGSSLAAATGNTARMHEHATSAGDQARLAGRSAKPPLHYQRRSTFPGSPGANDTCRVPRSNITPPIISGRGGITTPRGHQRYQVLAESGFAATHRGSTENMHDRGQTRSRRIVGTAAPFSTVVPECSDTLKASFRGTRNLVVCRVRSRRTRFCEPAASCRQSESERQSGRRLQSRNRFDEAFHPLPGCHG